MGYFSNQLVEMSESPNPEDREHAERVTRGNRAAAAHPINLAELVWPKPGDRISRGWTGFWDHIDVSTFGTVVAIHEDTGSIEVDFDYGGRIVAHLVYFEMLTQQARR